MGSIDDSAALRRKWDRRHREAEAEGAPEAALVLRDNRHLLPARGAALDLACGRGGNALLLADAGLDVHAWDLSPVAIEALEARAHPRIRAEPRDVIAHPPEADGFDVIVVSYFLHRPLMPRLTAALRPGGLLFYETFGPRYADIGPERKDFRLTDNELPGLLPGLRLRCYRDEADCGDLSRGFRDRVMLVGQRPG